MMHVMCLYRMRLLPLPPSYTHGTRINKELVKCDLVMWGLSLEAYFISMIASGAYNLCEII